MRALKAVALGLALACMPACASLRPAAAAFAAAQSLDQQAYALIASYAALLESAAPVMTDPATPAAVKRALAQAEAAATPAVELVKIAAVAHAREHDEATAAALADALLAAQAPLAALGAAVEGR
ncbi:MAG: hypothetical protein AB7M12_14450 [Hyphomonadaceae bacterium]